MPKHSDRRRTQQWAKSGPPLGVATGSPSDCVASLARVPDPHCATLLAEKLPVAITAVQPNVIWLSRSGVGARPRYAGGSATIAVKFTSQVSLPSTEALPQNLHTRARFWTKPTLRFSSTPGSTGARNLASSIAMK